MIRVGFDLSGRGTNWLGGLNYFRNLFLALQGGADDIVPVALTGRQDEAPGAGAEILRLPILDRWSPAWVFRKAFERVTGTDRLLDQALRAHEVSLLSHAWALGPRARLPVVGWIPDFQHRYLPEFCGAREAASRDARFLRTCRHARLVVVSSESARADLASFFPAYADKARVLRFVACSAATGTSVPLSDLRGRHVLPQEGYVFLPNQFWAHKNHATVVQALRILRERGRTVHVVCTGNPSDSRQPGAYGAVMAARREAGVEDLLHVLGIVPFADVAALLRHSVALLNPSLFEGWSTTVEEAKAVGKRVVLSDIPVHREQAPRRASYFPPRDAGALADALWDAWRSHDAAADAAEENNAAATLASRRSAFAATYVGIVREALR